MAGGRGARWKRPRSTGSSGARFRSRGCVRQEPHAPPPCSGRAPCGIACHQAHAPVRTWPFSARGRLVAISIVPKPGLAGMVLGGAPCSCQSTMKTGLPFSSPILPADCDGARLVGKGQKAGHSRQVHGSPCRRSARPRAEERHCGRPAQHACRLALQGLRAASG